MRFEKIIFKNVFRAYGKIVFWPLKSHVSLSNYAFIERHSIASDFKKQVFCVFKLHFLKKKQNFQTIYFFDLILNYTFYLWNLNYKHAINHYTFILKRICYLLCLYTIHYNILIYFKFHLLFWQNNCLSLV